MPITKVEIQNHHKMTTETTYNHFVIKVKNQIVHSRYLVARLVNREQLLLYFIIGKRLSEKVASENGVQKSLSKYSSFQRLQQIL